MRIYNSLTKRKEYLTTRKKGKVSIYVCGMTVYDYCHLGHGRMMVAFDVITRYLRAIGYDVKLVRNITDVDDKIIHRAKENEESPEILTARMINAMHEDEKRINILRPNQEPRAMTHIDEIISMINTLISNGFAYAKNNGIYYNVRRFANYGKLNNRPSPSRDFALWKSTKPGELSWVSPWGDGRPGWHIECSAMSTCCLGDSFDIHGGGIDLAFPHHENEIAQSEASTGQQYAKFWMHAGALLRKNSKMSKSMDNSLILRNVLKLYDPEIIRYLLLSSHYRSTINYTPKLLALAHKSLRRLYTALNAIEPEKPEKGEVDPAFCEQFFAAMNDDFNTSLALSSIFELARELNKRKNPALAFELKRLANILGLLERTPGYSAVW